jgi:hypothetical protein
VTTKYLAKFQSPRAITWPKIIGTERNVNLICNSSLYTHIPKIKAISPSIVVTTVLFRNYRMTDMGNTICPGHLVAGTYKFGGGILHPAIVISIDVCKLIDDECRNITAGK